MSLHEIVLAVHGTLRWFVLVAGLVAFGRAAVAARSGRAWTEMDAFVVRAFVGVFDLQALLGLFMYFGTSALGVRMLAVASIAMNSPVTRFFAVEHLTGMLVAASVLHVGGLRARRLGDSPKRHRRMALVVAITFVIVFLSIPWPFYPYGRPLLRLG